NEKKELDILIEDLRAALSLTRYNVRQKHGYGVYVTALEEMRGLEFDYMFIVGLNEGELPTRYVPEIFLPLVSQKENRKTQPYLQRHLFYQAVSSFNKKLFLIASEQTDDVHLIRSSFVDEFAEIVDPSFIHDTERGEKFSPSSREQNIYNIQQLIELHSLYDSHQKILSEHIHLLPTNATRCETAELERYKDNKESEFHGKINQPELVDSLNSSFADKFFSSAQIESLARCGFQYFARRILQIAEIPDIETSLSAIERGAVLHRILFRFYNELSHSGNLDNSKVELNLLLKIGRKVLDELGIEHDIFEMEKETILGNENIPGTLELFLTKVQTKLSEYGFHPQKFEVGFGMKGGTDEFSAVKIGNVSLRGKIDRIDSDSNGLSIFDYKTSSVISGHKDVVGDKISPQLILYLNALSQITNNNEAAGKPAGAAFLSINRDKLLKTDDGRDAIQFIIQTENGELRYNPTFGSKAKIAAAEDYPKTMADLLKQTESFVEEKVSEARGGRFNLTKFARDRVCTFCSYSEACRIALRGESFSS
ncbi:MAG: PD-(D/E)XK nuclease family protein, partial [Candidatus Kryptoniota bacterium]